MKHKYFQMNILSNILQNIAFSILSQEKSPDKERPKLTHKTQLAMSKSVALLKTNT